MLSHLHGGQIQLAVNKQSSIGWSPLIVASSKGHLEVVKVSIFGLILVWKKTLLLFLWNTFFLATVWKNFNLLSNEEILWKPSTLSFHIWFIGEKVHFKKVYDFTWSWKYTMHSVEIINGNLLSTVWKLRKFTVIHSFLVNISWK